jgi:fused signal recognition particle receptor
MIYMFFWRKKEKEVEKENEINESPEINRNQDDEPTDKIVFNEESGVIVIDQEKEAIIPDAAESLKEEPEVEEFREEEEPEKKPGFFARLKNRLAKTKNNIISKVKKVIQLRGKLDEELLEDIEEILIQADVGVETTMKIVDRLRENARERGIKEAEKVMPLFKEILQDIIENHERLLKVGEQRPYIITVVGVNGTGKTTTIGKLAKCFRELGLTTMLVAADTFRAAAVEQLEIWAKRSNSLFVKQTMGTDPASVCYDALHSAISKKVDVVLIDTAGRLHTKVNLMAELEKVFRVIKKIIPDAPHETIIVLDATTGQNAINQITTFSKSVPVSSVIMTKLDGTAKGGILIAIRDLFDIPIVKIGIGEQVDDLRDFNPREFVDALFEE